jgi:glycosyltransferase involved in cell wall biosynthesis
MSELAQAAAAADPGRDRAGGAMGGVPITAVVVSCNEARLLETCLPALAFCDEVIVVDMECTDDTVEVALRHGATVHAHQRLPYAEILLPWVTEKARHDWILHVDPDEICDPSLAPAMAEAISDADEKVASVEVPWQFYFGRRALKGTYWGGVNFKGGCLFHRDRVAFNHLVHNRPPPKEGFRLARIPWQRGRVLHHYWMQNYQQFLEKHRRYLRAEGERHRQMGRRFGWHRMLWGTLHSFAWSVLKKGGWRDGVTGIGLSGFYSWYVASSWLSLRRLERET